MNTCTDCGGPNAVVRALHGWLCLDCQEKRNDTLGELAATLGPVMQPVDPDGPPTPCGCADCGRDAAYITRVHTEQGLVGVTACDEHIPAMVKVVAQMWPNA